MGPGDARRGARTTVVDLESARWAPRDARHWLAGTVTAWGLDEQLRDVAVLLVSELVTNVVEHAGPAPAMQLEVTCGDDLLWVAVTDDCPRLPALRHPAGTEPRGRGLLLVDALANRWGYDEHAGGKRIWFALKTGELLDT